MVQGGFRFALKFTHGEAPTGVSEVRLVYSFWMLAGSAFTPLDEGFVAMEAVGPSGVLLDEPAFPLLLAWVRPLLHAAATTATTMAHPSNNNDLGRLRCLLQVLFVVINVDLLPKRYRDFGVMHRLNSGSP